MDIKIYNNQYNRAISPFVSEIFTTERIGGGGYVEVGDYRKNEIIYSPSIENVTDSISPEFKGEEICKLPEYEKMLITNLVFGENNNLVVAGAMGSGKTSTSDYVRTFIKKELSNYIDLIYITFNDSYHEDNSIQDILTEFREDLYFQLLPELEKRLSSDNNMEYIIKHLSENMESFREFHMFIKDINNEVYRNKLIKQKVDHLFAFIDNEFSNINRKLRCLLLILHAINQSDSIKHEFIIFYDNIDRFHPPTQIALLEEIIAKNNLSMVKSLVFMRRCTYKRFIGRGAFEPKYIHHHGPLPKNVIIRRCEFWLEQVDEHNLSKYLKPEFKYAIKQRLGYILKELNSNNSKLEHYVNSFAGRSIRIALTLISNIVINDIVRYDENPKYFREIPISILTPKIEAIEFDAQTINIFSYQDGNEFSIVQLRILQLVSSFKGINSQRNLPNIIRHLRYFDESISDFVIINTLNNLLNVERPLIWVNSTTKIKSIEHLNTINDEVRFTEIGFAYYKNLVIDTDYYQKCVESISRWEGEYFPVHVSPNMFQRFDYIRLTLLELLHIDIYQMENYNIELKLLYNKSSHLRNISSRIIYNITKCYLPRLNGLYYKDISERHNTFDDWLSLLIKCLDHDPYNDKLSSLIDKFSETKSMSLKTTNN